MTFMRNRAASTAAFRATSPVAGRSVSPRRRNRLRGTGSTLRTRSRTYVLMALLVSLAMCVDAPSGWATPPSENGVPTSSTTGCKTHGPSRVGKILGIVRPEYSGNSGTCPAPAPKSAPPFRGSPPLLYHGGPVLNTAPEGGQLTVTPIFWAPSGYTFTSSYRDVITGYLNNVAADSGKVTNVFASTTQYTDGSGNHINYNIVAGTPITDATPYPGGCSPDSGPIYSDFSGYSTCVDNSDLSAEAQNVVSNLGLPSGSAHMYLVFLPQGVESCFTSSNAASGGTCTLNNDNNAQSYCAYHSSLSDLIYASQPFPVYESPTGFTCSPEFGPGIQAPNGDVDADVEISPLSHEMNEAITDPFGSAWYDNTGNENGDDCAYIYGSGFGGAVGAQYNQTVNGGHYFVQEEFSNHDYFTDPNSACIQHEQPAVGAAGSFASVNPARILDTRSGIGASGPVSGGGTVALQVTGRGGIPSTGVAAVVLNVTVTSPRAGGFITAYPQGSPLPTASNLNFTAGQTIPNLVVVPVGARGKIDLHNGSPGTVQLLADIAGYYLAGTPLTRVPSLR